MAKYYPVSSGIILYFSVFFCILLNSPECGLAAPLAAPVTTDQTLVRLGHGSVNYSTVWKWLLKIWGAVGEKMSPKDSVEGADTLLRGSVRALNGFSDGEPKAAKPRGRSPQMIFQPRVFLRKIPWEPSHYPVAQCRPPRHSYEGTVIPLCPKNFWWLLRLPKSWGSLANEASPHTGH